MVWAGMAYQYFLGLRESISWKLAIAYQFAAMVLQKIEISEKHKYNCTKILQCGILL